MEMIKKFILSFWMPHSRKFWALLLLGFVFYEACGLYFQYVLKLNPCIECVYERACFMFFGVAALVGLIAPRFMINRILAALIWAVSSIWGLIIAIEHRGFEISYQTKDPFADTCVSLLTSQLGLSLMNGYLKSLRQLVFVVMLAGSS